MTGMKLMVLFLPMLAFAATPTIEDARKFLAEAEDKLLVLSNEANRAGWVQENFITFDTEGIAALANQKAIDEGVRLAKESTRFDGLKLPPEMARKILMLKLGLTLATPSNPKESAEVTQLAGQRSMPITERANTVSRMGNAWT